ncbi:ClpXP protease specificity-enhancing factor [Bowmanella dokdonensis]|uniref:ClpXP protease specificity-enhancing factor n=1 Tax=Bowmanella dokdonensis TaxID=751969 RepID=A0A939DLJ8_9ALTE|nr:ClpXP protease specificity-enhancing factor [Bowmanella dokdonensis]MBN7824076.1 ClpXP protease specificity-enhancing factor [Bowmanella dokdonensis]
MQPMTSNKPYLLRAFYEWIVDNQLTPHLVVDATLEGTRVPQEHVKDGQIVLNISPSACGKLQMSNLDVTFDARFGGVARQLIVPMPAVLAIYARENGAGTIFTPEEEGPEDLPPEPTPPKKGRPQLKVIK